MRKAVIIAAGALVMASPSFSRAADEKPYCTADKIPSGQMDKKDLNLKNDCFRKFFNFARNNPHLMSKINAAPNESYGILIFRGMDGIDSLFRSLYIAEDGIHAAAEDVYKTANALGLIKREGSDVEILEGMPKQMDSPLMGQLIMESAKEPKKRGKLGKQFRNWLEAPAETSDPAVPGGQVQKFYEVFFAISDELDRIRKREGELAGEEDLKYTCLKPSSYDISELTKAAKTIVSTKELRKEKGNPGGLDHPPSYEAALDYFDWELSERLAKDYVQVTRIFDRADKLLKKEGLANIPAGSLNKFKKLDTGKLQAVFDAPPRK